MKPSGVSTMTERMRLDSSGRLGLGTTSPQQLLHIRGAAANAGIRLESDGGSGETYEIRSLTNGVLTVGTTLANVLNVTPSSVGIGTTSPSAALHVTSSSAGSYGGIIYNTSTTGEGLALRAGSDSSHNILVAQNSDGSSTYLIVNAGGGVGIGTGSPLENLHISGVSSSGGIRLADGAANRLSIRLDSSNNPKFETFQAADSLVFSTGGSGVEKVRIDSSGRLLVGTTSSSGTTSNVAQVIAGNYTSFTGSVSAAHSTATTLFNLDNLSASYIVTAMITGTASANNYTAVYMIATVTNNSRVIQAIRAGALLTLSLSGGDVQATQSSGITQTIKWSVTRMANL